MGAWPVRGIANPTGTSCHVGSALVLLQYCLEPLGSVIAAEAAANSQNDDVVHWLGRIFHADQQEEINIKLTLDTLRKDVGIEARQVGDVITTFMKLINYLCQLTKDDQAHQAGKKHSISSVWNQFCNAGTVHSILLGHGEHGNDLCKKTKPRSMPVPFKVEMSNDEHIIISLLDAIQNTLKPRLVKDYIWEGHTPCDHTTRTLCIDNLPPVWILHLDWFAQTDTETARDHHRTVSIPSTITVQDIIHSDKSHNYELIGGILLSQVHDEEITDERDRRHYMPLIRKDNIWYMLDDDEIPQIISEERSTELFGGVTHGDESPFRRKDEHVSVCGYLLVYRDSTQQLDMRDESRPLVDWTRPKTLIGRRLRVQWAKGTFYSGVVRSYDETTDKHQIVYDDGDVKKYILRKKNIEWL